MEKKKLTLDRTRDERVRKSALIPEGLPVDPTATFDPSRTAAASGPSSQRPSGSAPPVSAPENRPREGTGTQAATPSARGEDVASPFRLHRVIGLGGLGEVWEATQLSLKRKVAVKQLQPHVYEDDADPQRRALDFRHEALSTAALDHPNIVPVYDAAEDGEGRLQLAMKLVRGRSWRELIEADRGLPVGELLARHLPILIDVSQAVAFAHSRGVLHRDLKPSQVLVGEFGEVLLVDWGLAMRLDEKIAAAPGEPAICPAGTPAYMAPEQTGQDAARLGTWTDVYLLGGILYFLLTGSPPHGGRSVAEVFLYASSGDLEPPRRRAPGREIPP